MLLTHDFTGKRLSLNSSYTYQVRATLAEELSEPSNAVNVVTQSGVPTGLSAATTTTSVSLNWTAPNGAAPDSYNVYRDGGLTPIATGLGSTNYLDDGRTPNTAYDYSVTAVFSGLESAAAELAAMAVTDIDTPNLNVNEAATTTGSVTMSWSDNNPDTVSYEVSGGGTCNVVGNTATCAELDSNQTYNFTVTAEGLNAQSAVSNIESERTLLSFSLLWNDVFKSRQDVCASCHGSTDPSTGNLNFHDEDTARTTLDDKNASTVINCVNNGCPAGNGGLEMTDEANENDFNASEQSLITTWYSDGTQP